MFRSSLEDSVENRRLRGATSLLSEAELTIAPTVASSPRSAIPKTRRRLAPGEVVDHKRLHGVFAWIAVQQRARTPPASSIQDHLRGKKRIRAAAAAVFAFPPEVRAAQTR